MGGGHGTLLMDSTASHHSHTGTRVALSAFLGLVVFAIYGRTAGYDFVLYDDMTYIVNNERLKDGLSLSNIFWSFTTPYFANWHPLTWLSYLLDIELFGLEPKGFHRTNVLIHALNSVMLLSWLSAATKRLWPSAFVALLFAIHPLHVESVAWISERKDVLSMFFVLATLITYTRYVRNPSSRIYVAVELLFVCALLAKPMAITLPLVLLLLDYWPYRRLSEARPLRSLVTEKIPLLVISALSAVLTLIAQTRGGGITPIDDWPLMRRPLTAMASYGTYAFQTAFPTQLSVFYPRYWGAEFWLVSLGGALFVGTVSYLALRTLKNHPYLAVGWGWFLVTLIPVIGIVQVGSVAHADRYTYIPQVGLLIAITWLIAHLVTAYPRIKPPIVALGLVASLLLSVAAYKQVGVWKNSETLFQNALVRSNNSEWLHWALGKTLMESKRYEEAHAQFDQALELKPAYPMALYTKAQLLLETGRLDEAESCVQQILVQRYDHAPSLRLLASIYIKGQQFDKALVQLDQVLAEDPNDIEARASREVALQALEDSRAP